MNKNGLECVKIFVNSNKNIIFGILNYKPSYIVSMVVYEKSMCFIIVIPSCGHKSHPTCRSFSVKTRSDQLS